MKFIASSACHRTALRPRAHLPTLLALLAPAIAGCPDLEYAETPAVRVITSQGEFAMLLKVDEAPAVTAAFTRLVEQGFYDATVVHRAVANSRVEIGGYIRSQLIEKTNDRAPIANEAGNGLTNLRGAIATARTDDPDSARSQFYINLKDNPDFDPSDESPGYAVFGRVVEGLDVADQIGAVATESLGGLNEVPVRDVTIRSASRVDLTGDLATFTGVAFDTTFGRIVFALDAAAAPVTVANFLAYVDAGFYVNTVFHRVVSDTLIQGGGFTRALTPKPASAPAPNESLNGLTNTRGAVAAAFAADYTTNASAFIINVADNPQFDANGAEFGYTVFAEIIEGLDVVDQIAAAATSERGGLPDVPVLDITIERMELYTVPTSLAAPENGVFGNISTALRSTFRDLLALLVRYGISSFS